MQTTQLACGSTFRRAQPVNDAQSSRAIGPTLRAYRSDMPGHRSPTPSPTLGRVRPLSPFPVEMPFQVQQPAPDTATGSSFKATGRTVVITGGSQGVGRATALLFARKGWNVVVAARDPAKLQYVADDCAAAAGRQGASLAVPCDVTDERQVKNLVTTAMARYQDVDCVISNAGVMARGPFLQVPAAEANRLMQTNYLGAYIVAQAFIPFLIKEAQRKQGVDRPSLIMVNSFGGKVPMKSMSAFTASKYALMGLTEAIRAELEPLGIHVGQVHPGVVKSNHLERTTFYGGTDEADERRAFRQAVRALPISQTPQEVADAIYNAAATKQNDVVVGMPFAMADLAYRMTGLNPTALPTPW